MRRPLVQKSRRGACSVPFHKTNNPIQEVQQEVVRVGQCERTCGFSLGIKVHRATVVLSEVGVVS